MITRNGISAHWIGAMAALLGAVIVPATIAFAHDGTDPLVQRIDPPAPPGARCPNLFATPNGDVLLNWFENHPDDAPSKSRRLMYSRYHEGAWSTPGILAVSDKFLVNWADFPSMSSDWQGEMLVVNWGQIPDDAEPGACNVVAARSFDDGLTWRIVGQVNDDETASEHGFVSLMPDLLGDVLAVWLDGREMMPKPGPDGHVHQAGGDMSLRAARIFPDSIKPSVLLDSRVCDCCNTDAAMTSAGPIVVYRDRDEHEIRDISYVRRLKDGWTPPRPVHVDGWRIPGCPVNGPAVAASGDLVAVAWFTAADPADRILVSFSRDGGDTFDTPVVIDHATGSDSPVGRVDVVFTDEYGSVGVLRSDAVVTWVGRQDHESVVRLRSIAVDGRLGEPLTLPELENSRVTGCPRLVRAGNKLVVTWAVEDADEVSHVLAATIPLSSLPTPPILLPPDLTPAAPQHE